jgi:uncharacterized membrane protein YqgA involved in biofilm formation
VQGTIVNAAAIIVGSLIGVALKKNIKPEYQKTVTQALALAVGVMGIEMALKSSNILIVVISLVIGGILGEMLDIEGKLNKLGAYLAKLIKKTGGESSDADESLIGKAFVTASLIYCVGAMAVIGSIQDGLTGDTSVLYVKALLDGIFSVALASSIGIGVALSSASVFLYQGAITLLAGILAPLFSEAVINELTATGGILIIGVSILILEVIKIRLANWLPAIPVAITIAYFWTG